MNRALIGLLLLIWLGNGSAVAVPLSTCLEESGLVRIARVLNPDGQVVYAQVLEQSDGHITRAVAIADANTPLVDVFGRTSVENSAPFPVSDHQVCAVVDLPQTAIDGERQVIISTGLNFAAHAEEAGGGDVFLFPKPAAPTRPYAHVAAPAGVVLFDYEVELAYVLLQDIDLAAPLSREEFLANSAFFLSNDLSDREAIIMNASISGPGVGFVQGKGQPGFLPAGPWMVRGTELFAAVEACGAGGLGLELSVDAGTGPVPRQSSNTELMIIKPYELISYLANWIKTEGFRTVMPFDRAGVEVFYPMAIDEENPSLTAGSIVQTGTPSGVALGAPESAVGLIFRGILKLRSPFEQFLFEERARFSAGGTAYLKPGDKIVARIDGLGAQIIEIDDSRAQAGADLCVELVGERVAPV